MNFDGVPKGDSQLRLKLRGKSGAMTSPAPMANQPKLVVMVLPCLPRRIWSGSITRVV